jgi:predicted Zn-dependent protease with MMP-like domain
MLPHKAPSYESRSKKFARLVEEAVRDLETRFPASMTTISIAVEPVPSKRDLVLNDGNVALGRGERSNPSRVVLYQHPIELRSTNDSELDRIIRDVLALYVGLIIGMRPDQVDPDYHGPE